MVWPYLSAIPVARWLFLPAFAALRGLGGGGGIQHPVPESELLMPRVFGSRDGVPSNPFVPLTFLALLNLLKGKV